MDAPERDALASRAHEAGAPAGPEAATAHVDLRVDLPVGMQIRLTIELLPVSEEEKAAGAPEIQVVTVPSGEKEPPVVVVTRPYKPDGARGNQASHGDAGLAPQPIELPGVAALPEPGERRARPDFSQVGKAVSGISARLFAPARSRPLAISTILFGLALCVYLATRLIGLARFPIYFFTDEAVQTVLAADLVRDGFHNYEGIFLPTYFKNGNYYNLSTSVYLQVLPYVLFGKSIFVTRAVSVLVSLLAALSVGLILKDIFKATYWWSGVLLLSIAPAWFLHTRTAFETVIFVSFYAATLYFYLLYRYRSERCLYLALVSGALAFYAYSPGQVVIAVTALLLFFFDLPYHWQKRSTILAGLALLAILAVPYVRFRLWNNSAPLDQLRNLGSYWVQPGSLSEKTVRFAQEYLRGISPAYWFFPNQVDLARHLMKGYGHLSWWTLPFAALGLLMALRNVTSPAHRVVIAALLAAPTGSALVEVGITRTLVFVIPACLLTGLGLSKTLDWIAGPVGQLKAIQSKTIDQIADPVGQLKAIRSAPLLRWAGSIRAAISRRIPAGISTRLAKGLIPEGTLAMGICAALVIVNFAMLRDALINGPTWYTDYGMGGMQYGASQLFPVIQNYLLRHPGTKMVVSPSWSNGTDVVARFFMPEPIPFEMGSIEGHMFQKLPLDENMVFVMISDEYEKALSSGKFTDIRVEQTLLYPNGQPGFYFVHLRYVEDIDAILEAEREARRQLEESQVTVEGQTARVRYSPLDMGDITLLFDGDPHSVARTLEANPFVVEVTFPQPRSLSGFSITIGSLEVKITARLYSNPGAEPVEYSSTYKGAVDHPETTLDFGRIVPVQIFYLEVQSIHESEPAHVHIWEITLK